MPKGEHGKSNRTGLKREQTINIIGDGQFESTETSVSHLHFPVRWQTDRRTNHHFHQLALPLPQPQAANMAESLERERDGRTYSNFVVG